MSYSGIGRPLGAFGLNVEYPGGKGAVNTGPHCGDARATQQMLQTLGFNNGPITGQWDQNWTAALIGYGLSKGIVYNGTLPPQGELCAALIADYSGYQAETPPASATECAPGQWGIPPLCFGEPSAAPPPEAGTCPAGSIGLPPYCVAPPGELPAAPSGGSCPDGQVGVPPHCYAVPAPGTTPVTPPGTPPAPPGGRPSPPTQPGTPAPPPPPPPSGPAPAKASFWQARSGVEKVAMVAGIAVVGVLVLGSVGGPRKTRKRATPNRAGSKKTKRPALAKRRKKRWAQKADASIEARGTAGSFTEQARRAGYDDTLEYARKVMTGWDDGSHTVKNKKTGRNQRITTKTMRRANFALNVQPRKRRR